MTWRVVKGPENLELHIHDDEGIELWEGFESVRLRTASEIEWLRSNLPSPISQQDE